MSAAAGGSPAGGSPAGGAGAEVAVAAAWDALLAGEVTLTAPGVRLEPLDYRHIPDLAVAAADPDIWTWLPVAPPTDATALAVLVIDAITARATGTRVPYAIVAGGAAIGSTSYLDLDAANRRVEVGWTWLGRPWWGTSVNPAAKLAMLGHAFDVLGCERVALKTDHENVRSQSAIARLGARREGVLRHHVLRPDGTWRDTVYYSVLAEEWPAVRAGLLDRLADARPADR